MPPTIFQTKALAMFAAAAVRPEILFRQALLLGLWRRLFCGFRHFVAALIAIIVPTARSGCAAPAGVFGGPAPGRWFGAWIRGARGRISNRRTLARGISLRMGALAQQE